ncbi:sensor histidine kinase [Actinoplanes lobatus]|uniref:histidine kinase n=1 Tax=Actinoplanes lobatus TaxID=113568 RepID=A0A7W7MFC2_9ACTN|nr:sensor histidine kinase [Actinoplanes lobatus]MBB4748096.1 signal transduction histidine kinase [Actinoplanes lobatus]GGN69614.1 sensor histidine kinase [Actinoplanes lobatus]GIE45757.1 sensor histidine kinase [Actinoplanes lobatus]
MTSEPLMRMRLRVEQDIFVVRQLGREVARTVGLESQDQTRVATALSEVARALLAVGLNAEVAFTVPAIGVPTLLVTMAHPDAGAAARIAGQLQQVGRLVDTMEVDEGESGTVVRMSRRLPPGAPLLTPERMSEIRAGLSEHVPGTPLDELAVQNQQLIAALDEVRAQRDDLARLNVELEETNRGVMALYNQLSQELEETNRGVVALYAELDEKSAQLRAASEAKSRFLANVSHELRAPVTAIIGLGRLLTDSGSDELTGEQHRQVDLIRTSASDLLALVNGLLDLAKAEAGRIEPHWSEVDLRAVFGQLRGTLRPLATRPEVDFVVEEPAVPALRSDEVLLAQVLRNLLTNALKFTESGSVRLSVAPAGTDIEFVVADTGTGIPPELHERIFEEFYQVPGSKPVSGKGTGLGLTYARRLAGILGGGLRVDSTPGRGSVFTLRLPTAS